MRLALVIFSAFAVGLAGTVLLLSSGLLRQDDASAGPREDAGAFVTRIVGFVVSDQYARAWPSLNPAHQRVAGRSEYVSCELRTPVGWTLQSADVLRTAERRRRVPGIAGRLDVTAVTLRLEIRNAALGMQRAFVHTFNAVADGPRWTWILTPTRYELYRSDGCAV